MDTKLPKTAWFKNPKIALVVMAVLLVISAILIYQYRYPTGKIKQLIKQGSQAEQNYDFNQAIAQYQAALILNDYNSELRYQTLSHLAIVFARDYKTDQALETIDTINDEYPSKETINAKLELAILACSSELDDNSYRRAMDLWEKLDRTNNVSLDDDNNLQSLRIRYFLIRQYKGMGQLRLAFEKILSENPNHLAANYNLFRIARNESRGRDQTDDTHLKKCLSISDDPQLIYLQLSNAARDVNRGAKPIEDYLDLIKRYGQKGGQKAHALVALNRIASQEHRSMLKREVESIPFGNRKRDLFVFFGIANPLDSNEL